MRRGKWIHSDTDCPLPRGARRSGRVFECTCGRIWRYRVSDYGTSWSLTLLSEPQDQW